MPQGGKSYHLIFKKPPLVSPAPPPARRLRRTPPAWRPPEEYSLRQTVLSWAFWNLTGGTALRLLAKTGATVHLLPILASKGVSEQTAAFLLGGELFLTVPLYLVLGWAADRFPKPSVLMWASLAGTAAFALLAVPWHGMGVLLAFVVLFALCDASAPTNWAVVGEYFGRQTFSRLQGYIQLVNFPGALCAPVFLGWWYDHHHTYAFPLWIYTGVSLVGALTFAVLTRPPGAALAPGGAPPAPAAGSPQASDASVLPPRS